MTYATIRYTGDFADAYSGSISEMPMDYRTDCEGWEDALENLAEEEVYKALLMATDELEALSADWEGDYEKQVTVDGSVYESWKAECLGESRLIQPVYQELTAENIEALEFLESD